MGGLSTVDLLVLTSLDQLLFYVENIICLFYKTIYLNEEVNHAESELLQVPFQTLETGKSY